MDRDHLFISYAWEDSQLAEWLALKLTAEGFKVWCDRLKLLDQKGISLGKNRGHIGQILEILVEGPSRRDPEEWFGRTDGHKMAVFRRTGQNAGDYVGIEITDATANTLKGKLI